MHLLAKAVALLTDIYYSMRYFNFLFYAQYALSFFSINNYLFMYNLIYITPHRRFTRTLFSPESAQRSIVKIYCVIVINVFYSPDDG